MAHRRQYIYHLEVIRLMYFLYTVLVLFNVVMHWLIKDYLQKKNIKRTKIAVLLRL